MVISLQKLVKETQTKLDIQTEQFEKLKKNSKQTRVNEILNELQVFKEQCAK
jgi:hypothetical protein